MFPIPLPNLSELHELARMPLFELSMTADFKRILHHNRQDILEYENIIYFIIQPLTAMILGGLHTLNHMNTTNVS